MILVLEVAVACALVLLLGPWVMRWLDKRLVNLKGREEQRNEDA